jgi:addiction module HigA family antidote
MSVKKAAELMGVGRPALSNLLNGKASLSADMALRLEKAFGEKREGLLQMQAAYDDDQTRHRAKAVAVRAYAPSFLDITATQVEAWSGKVEARSQLPALLRKLVLTTGTNITKCDFPAFDYAQTHGWDGQVETDTATPWVPAGVSGWEFGCNQNPKAKAEEDYKARVASIPATERENTTFVFVTPRRWLSKDAWVKEKANERRWKDVKAFDANDLEQWLEQSVPAQNWISERLGNGTDEILSLEECWDRWANVTKPELSKTLFVGSVQSNKNSFADWLKNPPTRPYVITSDSEEETLAYLACALDMQDVMAGGFTDKALVLRSVSALRRATKSSLNFIAVLVTPEVEEASAGLYKTQHTIIVRRRNAVEGSPDIELDLVDDGTFKQGLIEMGVPEEDVHTLSHASGQSLTILRRRLSDVPAIKFPPWAEDSALTRKLIPLGFAGAWNSELKEDKEILSYMMGDKYENIEKAVAELLNIEHSPVWSIGRFRGVASKLDVLYAMHRLVTKDDLDNFFLTARIVLSERDPALDLPEDKRYMASLYGKSRNHSDALREGMRETLVLLAIHGNNLFRERLGIDVEALVDVTIRELLMPFAAETWASQRRDLPRYAEAAPDCFLDIVSQDLKSSDPQILALLKPASVEVFGGGCPRSGLLWALELLAWKPERMPIVANILARMSEIKIDDNWSNKPENSLEAIFRNWMPQTAAPVEQRCAVLETLTRRFPDVGWRLCLEQFDPSSTIGHYSHRPRWRKDASGTGQAIVGKDPYTFSRKALELAIEWPNHNEKTLGDLVQQMHVLEDADQARIWDKIRAWIASGPTEEKKAILRECVRLYSFTRRARGRKAPSAKLKNAAREIYDALVASDPVVRHQWLFARQWVEESWNEIDDDKLDYQKREEKIAKLRADAITEIWKAAGYDGILRLCESGEASNYVGWILAEMSLPGFDAGNVLFRLASEPATRSPAAVNMCLGGYFARLGDAPRVKLLSVLIARFQAIGKAGDDGVLRVLKDAPSKRSTWQLVDALPRELQDRYWSEANPHNWPIDDADELREMVDRLLLAKRPKAALSATRLWIEKLDSPRIVRLLKEVATTPSPADENVRFRSYDFARAFETLDDRADVSPDELARLEFLYLSGLEHEKRGIPNLERQLAADPVMFVQAVGLVYRRKGGDVSDPPEWHFEDAQARESVATQAYHLLHNAKRIPGTDESGKIDVPKLKAWINDVGTQCKGYGREEVGDSCIGELLSKSKPGSDGIWPAVAVRDVLEEVGNEKIAKAMAIGLYNQRGVHRRDVDGRQERDLAAKYREWSKQIAVEWPFTSQLLEQIARSYDYDAKWHDTDASLRRRLP